MLECTYMPISPAARGSAPACFLRIAAADRLASWPAAGESGNTMGGVGLPLLPADSLETTYTSKNCHCKKSMCLKLYCDCFAAGIYCSNCACSNCMNDQAHSELVMQKRDQIKQRDPEAFVTKIRVNQEATAQHKKGCNCRRSHCLKKYCECFQAAVKCGSQCKCTECRNIDGGPSRPPSKPEATQRVHKISNAEQQVRRSTTHLQLWLPPFRFWPQYSLHDTVLLNHSYVFGLSGCCTMRPGHGLLQLVISRTYCFLVSIPFLLHGCLASMPVPGPCFCSLIHALLVPFLQQQQQQVTQQRLMNEAATAQEQRRLAAQQQAQQRVAATAQQQQLGPSTSPAAGGPSSSGVSVPIRMESSAPAAAVAAGMPVIAAVSDQMELYTTSHTSSIFYAIHCFLVCFLSDFRPCVLHLKLKHCAACRCTCCHRYLLYFACAGKTSYILACQRRERSPVLAHCLSSVQQAKVGLFLF